MGDERQGRPPAPHEDGWLSYDVADGERFNDAIGPLLLRREEDGRARLRMMPALRHRNPGGAVHGGAIMTLIDIALFGTCHMAGIADLERAVTLDCQTQFLGAGRIGTHLDAVGEIVRETGRLVFLRGLVEQDGALCASFSGIMRKGSAPR